MDIQPPVFGDVYAGQYDLLYAEKDYVQECDLVEAAFQRYAGSPIRTIVDLGCGTGNHAIPLAGRGYRVTGVDLSPAMLDRAAAKATAAGAGVRWIAGDLRTVEAGGPHDAAIALFAVLGYLTDNEDLLAALANVRRHLRSGGLFLFDVWYGPAVLAQPPADRVKVVTPDGGPKVIRATNARLDPRFHRCDVRFHLWRIEGDRLAAEVEEVHRVRYFFPLEIDLLLRVSGFECLGLTAFPMLEQEPDETSWNVFVVARAK